MLNPLLRKAKRAASRYLNQSFVFTSEKTGNSNRSCMPPIIGYGIGKKTFDINNQFEIDTIRIYVPKFVPGLNIPKEFEGVPTDIIEVGKIISYQESLKLIQSKYTRPAFCGSSIGHFLENSRGTLGALVQKEGNHYILSNNHVLTKNDTAKPGDIILQPGIIDGGRNPNDKIAVLEPYKSIELSKSKPNLIDAAIALIGSDKQRKVIPEIIDIGRPKTTIKPPEVGQKVLKYGIATGKTLGVIVDCNAEIFSDYGNGLISFENQIMIDPIGSDSFASSGDSGSLIVDARTLEPIGLLFAVCQQFQSFQSAYANPINKVLEYYQITFV